MTKTDAQALLPVTVEDIRGQVLDIIHDTMEAEYVGHYIAGMDEAADKIAALLATRQSLPVPGDVGMREHDKPPSHWHPDDRYADRQPQTPEEWDWRADGPDNGALSRSIKRLNYGADRADPHAPDQMATVLRIDVMRVTAQLTWLEAKTRMQADKIAALTPSAVSGDAGEGK